MIMYYWQKKKEINGSLTVVSVCVRRKKSKKRVKEIATTMVAAVWI